MNQPSENNVLTVVRQIVKNDDVDLEFSRDGIMTVVKTVDKHSLSVRYLNDVVYEVRDVETGEELGHIRLRMNMILSGSLLPKMEEIRIDEEDEVDFHLEMTDSGKKLRVTFPSLPKELPVVTTEPARTEPEHENDEQHHRATHHHAPKYTNNDPRLISKA